MPAKPVTAVLLNDTRNDHHHGCSIVVETILDLASHSGIRILGTSPVHADWRQNSSFKALMDSADLVIVNGEGTIHHDRPAGEHLLAAGLHARSLGKPSALINTTWQANGQRYLEMVSSFDIVSVRESASLTELDEAGVKCRRIADLALCHQPPAATNRSGVVFTDSVLGEATLEIYRKMWALGASPLNILFGRRSPRDFAIAVRRLMRSTNSRNPGALLTALRGATMEWLTQTADREIYLQKLASSELLVTGRFHAMIFALATRTPLLGVSSNTSKIESTLADAGLEPWRIVSPGKIDGALLRRASRWSEAEAANLEGFVQTTRADARQLFEDLHAIAS